MKEERTYVDAEGRRGPPAAGKEEASELLLKTINAAAVAVLSAAQLVTKAEDPEVLIIVADASKKEVDRQSIITIGGVTSDNENAEIQMQSALEFVRHIRKVNAS